jgi:hypothetical protein
MFEKNFILIIFILFSFVFTALKGQNIDFFNYWTYYSDIENSLYKHHCENAFQLLKIRKGEIDKLKTKEDWIGRQAYVREKLMEIIHPFAEKQPLNAQISDILIKDGYRIEKIIYQSLPDYYVTAAMYIPEGVTQNAPAIFYACGHSLEGFRADIYQHIIINLVKKGFVVFTIDPMGQGERYEYWDQQENKPVFPIPDHQHSYAGAQCLISGYSIASYFIWDVIRGIDYMMTRPEVDPERIGMTGRSGGGNLTAYLGAIDDRIVASAPECYITNYEYLLKTIGPQCAEQNLYQMILQGLDHPDFIIARAPKPTLIISTTRDIFSIQGARESYWEAKKMYDLLDADEMLDMVEDDTIHKSTRRNREAMYAFFQKYLNNPGSLEDLEVKVPEIHELQITKSGQIQTALSAETVFSLNKRIAQRQIGKLEESRSDYEKHLEEIPSIAARISGYKDPENSVEPVFSGRFVNPGHIIEKYLIAGSDHYMLPILLLKPTGFKLNEMIILLDAQGMENAMTEDSLVYMMLNKGYSVLLADLPGIGEMGPGYMKGDSYIEGISFNQWFAAVLTGKSHVGLRSQDIVKIIHFIKNDHKEFTNITAIAKGPLGSDLLHASVFDPEIAKVCLIKPFLSFESIAATQYYESAYIPFTVAGAIGSYDLPDLLAVMAPRKILIIDPDQADGMPASETEIQKILTFPIRVYTDEGFKSHFIFKSHLRTGEIQRDLLIWLRE